jgi:outer membrane protein OmpA-like peptidoglycan-associated protein
LTTTNWSTQLQFFLKDSSVLLLKGKADIDAAAARAKTENTKGWVVSVVGFADSSGNTPYNKKKLNERRANAVIGYLVSKHNLPLQATGPTVRLSLRQAHRDERHCCGPHPKSPS